MYRIDNTCRGREGLSTPKLSQNDAQERSAGMRLGIQKGAVYLRQKEEPKVGPGSREFSLYFVSFMSLYISVLLAQFFVCLCQPVNQSVSQSVSQSGSPSVS